jgi:hypothetical protein
VDLRFSSSGVKHTIIRYTSLELTKRTSLIIILIFTTIAIFDSVIVRYSAYTGIEPTTDLGVAIIIAFFIIYTTIGVYLLTSVKKIISRYSHTQARGTLSLRHFHIISLSAFVLTLAIVLAIILQIIFADKYSIALLRAQTYLSHIIPLIFLSFLVFRFGVWLTSSRRNYIIFLYAVSCSLLSINIVVSLLYLDSYYSSPLRDDRSWYPIISIVINHRTSPSTESLSLLFDVLSLSSFLVMWIATSILLSQYRHRMGRIKYFLIISVPLLYYIYPFQNYFGGTLSPVILSAHVIFTVLYIVTFSATKQVGAFVFSLSFWTSSELLYDTYARKSILLSSIGIAILFGAIQITPLQYRVYPPYGLITEAFIPLGAYVLLAGIFSAATYISQDARLRKEFYNSAASQLRLFRGIGVSEMQRELEKKVEIMTRKTEFLEEDDRWELKEEDIQQTLQDVLNEVYSKRKDDKMETKE